MTSPLPVPNTNTEPVVTVSTPEIEEAEQQWKEFKKWFWALVFTKITFKLIASLVDESEAMVNVELLPHMLIVFAIQAVPVIAMVWVVAKHSYAFTRKKSAYWNGLLGLFWFATIGIAIAYFSVKRLYKNRIKELTPQVEAQSPAS